MMDLLIFFICKIFIDIKLKNLNLQWNIIEK